MFAVCVKPSARKILCLPRQVWVKSDRHEFYVSLAERGLWDTKEQATRVITEPAVEVVVEVRPAKGAAFLPVIPEGWVLVPTDPTREMLDAAESVDWGNEDIRGNCCNQWNVMLAAAPSPPSIAKNNRKKQRG